MKLITAAALSLAMMTGAALAQTTSSNNPGETKDFWTDQAMVGALYTDDTMTTLRTGDEFKAAWMGMTPESQAAMKQECEAAQNRPTNAEAICSQISTF